MTAIDVINLAIVLAVLLFVWATVALLIIAGIEVTRLARTRRAQRRRARRRRARGHRA